MKDVHNLLRGSLRAHVGQEASIIRLIHYVVSTIASSMSHAPTKHLKALSSFGDLGEWFDCHCSPLL
jgi:hypothetical protein